LCNVSSPSKSSADSLLSDNSATVGLIHVEVLNEIVVLMLVYSACKLESMLSLSAFS
jgi:hypothetical protein